MTTKAEKIKEEIERIEKLYGHPCNYYEEKAKLSQYKSDLQRELAFLESPVFDYGYAIDTEDAFNLLNAISKRINFIKKELKEIK